MNSDFFMMTVMVALIPTIIMAMGVLVFLSWLNLRSPRYKVETIHNIKIDDAKKLAHVLMSLGCYVVHLHAEQVGMSNLVVRWEERLI